MGCCGDHPEMQSHRFFSQEEPTPSECCHHSVSERLLKGAPGPLSFTSIDGSKEGGGRGINYQTVLHLTKVTDVRWNMN